MDKRQDKKIDPRAQPIVDFLEAMRKMSAEAMRHNQSLSDKKPTKFEYQGSQDIVLKHGRVFDQFIEDVPENEQYSKAKECFYNALMVSTIDRDFTYTEGYGYDPEISFAIHHAWLVDADGRVYDPTWGHRKGAVYLGVPMTFEYVYEGSVHDDVFYAVFSEYFDYTSPMPVEAIVEIGDPL